MEPTTPGPASDNNFISPVKVRASKYMGIYLSLILFVIAFGFGYLSGQKVFAQKEISTDESPVTIDNVINIDRENNPVNNVDFNQFWTVWDAVKSKYVTNTVSDADLFYGAIQGLVMSLDDPYSVYMPPKVAEQFTKDLSGELEGIGAEIGVKGNQLQVVTPMPDTPAEKAGLRPGDKILFIDKVSTFGMNVVEAVDKIRGKGGTKVMLTISRDGSDDIQDITITRAKIIVPSVLYSMRSDKVAVLRVLQFNEDTMPLFNKYLAAMQKDNATALILDLRNNPGGFLTSAIDMASLWVDNGAVVSEKGRDGSSKIHDTEGAHPLANMKTAVLVNKGSASASEIVAGALQDNKKATVIGEQTFGKGSVQDFEIFPDGSGLKLTVAEWYTPGGRNINKEGIAPNIEVKEDWSAEKVGQDIVIDKAIEVLTGVPAPIYATSTVTSTK